MGLNASRLAAATLIAGIAAIVVAIAIIFGPEWGLMAGGIGAISLALEELHVRPS